jgi:hypothetical protein
MPDGTVLIVMFDGTFVNSNTSPDSEPDSVEISTDGVYILSK